MKPRKTGNKSARKSAPGKPFAPGDDPRRGKGPAKGAPGAGRPPEQYREWCRSLVSDPKAEAEVMAILRNNKHPAFPVMYKALTDRGYGKPMQHVEQRGDTLIRIVREPTPRMTLNLGTLNGRKSDDDGRDVASAKVLPAGERWRS